VPRRGTLANCIRESGRAFCSRFRPGYYVRLVLDFLLLKVAERLRAPSQVLFDSTFWSAAAGDFVLEPNRLNVHRELDAPLKSSCHGWP
jgi:hypothetical protein